MVDMAYASWLGIGYIVVQQSGSFLTLKVGVVGGYRAGPLPGGINLNFVDGCSEPQLEESRASVQQTPDPNYCCCWFQNYVDFARFLVDGRRVREPPSARQGVGGRCAIGGRALLSLPSGRPHAGGPGLRPEGPPPRRGPADGVRAGPALRPTRPARGGPAPNLPHHPGQPVGLAWPLRAPPV